MKVAEWISEEDGGSLLVDNKIVKRSGCTDPEQVQLEVKEISASAE